ncbi:MAG: OB-fold nucleic acid binding domain-containing protein [Candidatus Hermodarchaeota archaeon]
MTINQNYQFFPAISCWIKHLQEGKFNNQEKLLFTIFGSIKRVKIVATIIEMEEFISKTASDDIVENTNVNYRFILDDGTGLVNAVKWTGHDRGSNNTNLDGAFKALRKGDLIKLIGRINSWNNRIQISIENAFKLSDPNYTLLHDAQIVKKLKTTTLYEIPQNDEIYNDDGDSLNIEEEFLFNSVSDDIDIDKLFSSSKTTKSDNLKEKVYTIIEEFSQTANGISLGELKSKVSLTDENLKTLLDDLIMESRIYQPEENFYQSF